MFSARSSYLFNYFFVSLIIEMLIEKNIKLETTTIVFHKALKFVFLDIIEFEPNFTII